MEIISASVVWALLVAIGVSDAQRHRIPNKMVLMLLALVVVNLMVMSPESWMSHFLGAVTMFGACLLLYSIGAMAGGDVKLLAVIGLWIGFDQLSAVAINITLAGGVVGMFYLALYVASSEMDLFAQTKGYVYQKLTPGWKSKPRLVIPFAPVIVIGLAYHFYTL